MYEGYTIIPNGRPTWAPLLAASSEQSHEPLFSHLSCRIEAVHRTAFVGDVLKAFLARQVPTSRRRRTAAKTDSCG